MAESIDVYLITGFLGSGKTTLLNQIIGQMPKDYKLMILMNEFGEIGIDGTLVAGEDLDILEVSKGSIFCACVKTDFIKGLYEIAHKIKPDILLVEATGVANPADMKKDLELSVFQGIFRFKEQFCVVDAANFLDAFQVYASVEHQIASSTRFIINKTDLASREQIEEIKELIARYHPDPQFMETTYARVDVRDLLSLESSTTKEWAVVIPQMTDVELEQYVEDMLSDPRASITPPDLLISASFFWKGGPLSAIEDMSGQLPPGVVRAKGFIRENGKTYLYNNVMGRYVLEEYGQPIKENQRNVLVFIAPPEVMALVEDVMKNFGFVKTGEVNRQAYMKT
ncbi:hypothetical protein GFC01_10725 [Desulfofundulus thermobenzoicus]|uniref:GTP-binding protein n=1 Tax=Desulfofundulus thermobenzoicus TaxID=29376 RepID=A0A6N7ITD9_9FIRM|nr:CobW family GTP-binding protein [Desulfofundulus thermobenzoicus]MQL52727.1 hypothetical protein [Desulfofundulus thermobenzoicus]